MPDQPNKSPNRKERRLAIFGPPRDAEISILAPTDYWWPRDKPYIKRPAFRVFSGIPALAVVAWLIPNFLQMRGVVNIIASRVPLYGAALILIVYTWVALLSFPKPHRIIASITTLAIAVSAFLVDIVTLPKPKQSVSIGAVVSAPVAVEVPPNLPSNDKPLYSQPSQSNDPHHRPPKNILAAKKNNAKAVPDDELCPPATGLCVHGNGAIISGVNSLGSPNPMVVKGDNNRIENVTTDPQLWVYANSPQRTEALMAQLHKEHNEKWEMLSEEDRKEKQRQAEELEQQIRQAEGDPDKVVPLLTKLWVMR